jgi:hypothetical protein
LTVPICGLVDGETVVAAVMVETTETNDVVVDADVVERLDTVVWADVAEQTDVFFLAFSDYTRRLYISTRDKSRHFLITHIKVPIRLCFGIWDRIGAPVEGWVLTRTSETGSRFRCLRSSSF